MAAEPAPPLFQAEDLACRRGGRFVVEGVAFELEPGEALVLRGPNGSGKSSLLRLLAGFDRPAAGRLSWHGADVAADPSAHRARLHYLGHADAVKGALTVRENLAFAAALAAGGGGGAEGDGGDGVPALRRALAAFGLEDLAEAPARLLSAGQRRRLALARLLAAERRLWLLDEPGVGLDAASRGRLEAALTGHRRAGGVAVLASHGDVTVADPLVLDLGDAAG